MKKLLIVLFLCPVFFNQTHAEETVVNKNAEVVLTKAEKRTEIKLLSSRLKEIHAIAMAGQLSVTEKKQFREEVQNIQKQLEKMEGVYLYLSLTAILIIILLIVLL